MSVIISSKLGSSTPSTLTTIGRWGSSESGTEVPSEHGSVLEVALNTT